MRKLVLAAVLTAWLCPGCWGDLSPRPASIEVVSQQGRWRIDGARSMTLDLGGWKIGLSGSEVDAIADTPILERLVLEIINTSIDGKLHVEPDEIMLTGLAGPLFLGPADTVTIAPGQSWQTLYDRGLRAPMTPYPFKLTVTVFGGPDFQNPRSVSVFLY